MRRRVWCALVAGSALAACNAITNIGDYTFDGADAAPEAAAPSDAPTTPDADATAVDASHDVDATIADAGTPDADADAADADVAADADANADAACRIPSPNTTERQMVCGSTTCDLNAPNISPPYRCCSAPDGSASCNGNGETCPKPSFEWICTRAYQCPYPSPCCLTVDEITPTCPPTAHALESKCRLDSDAGCNLDLELCTGNEECRKPGTTCMRLEIVGTGARPLGVCL